MGECTRGAGSIPGGVRPVPHRRPGALAVKIDNPEVQPQPVVDLKHIAHYIQGISSVQRYDVLREH